MQTECVFEDIRVAVLGRPMPPQLQCATSLVSLPLPGGELREREADIIQHVWVGLHLLNQEPDLFPLPYLIDDGFDEGGNMNSHFSSPCFVLAKARSRNQPSQTTIVTASDNFRLSSMKRSRLPLTALRAFEAAGRHESFKKAAAELCVSEAAISRQVRDLERSFSLQLFSREHRAVHLTDKGRDLLGRVSLGFDAIDTALTKVAGLNQQTIGISVEPTFANQFLVPLLGEFGASHPEVDVLIDASSALADLRAPDGPSLAIRYSLDRSSWPGVEARLLVEDWITPMVSARLGSRIQQPRDLLHLKLLKDETSNGWTRWLSAAGIEDTPDWGPTFSNAATAVQGAEFGQGAVLGNRLLCYRLLSSGRIVAPFELAIPNGAYWTVSRDFSKLSNPETLFVDWLHQMVNGPAALNVGAATSLTSPRNFVRAIAVR